jgi:penicillin-binding protein A
MTSSPSYEPNRLLEEGYLASLGEGALINRATQGLFTPGSTWKTVTMIAALDTGQVKPDTIFDFGEPRVSADGSMYYVYEVDGGVIPDPNHKENRLDLAMSYVYSANAAFAKIGDDMDPDVMIDYASRFGFSNPDYTKRFPLELPVNEPQLANDVESIRTNNLLRASTGFGQGELLATPISMAMVVESVINDGSIPVPYFVESIRSPQGRVIRRQPNDHLVRGLMKPETAQQVKKMMAQLTEKIGGEQYIGYPDVKMGIKTGTAQVGGDLSPHGWLMGYAEKGERSVVVVIVLEHGGGSQYTLPVFQSVSQAAIREFILDETP